VNVTNKTGEKMTTETQTIASSIRVLTKIESTIVDHERELAVLKQYRDTAEQQVIDALIEEAIDRGVDPNDYKTKVDGKTYSLDTTIAITPLDKESGPAVVRWISENGGHDMFQPTMPWQRRNSFLRETFVDDDDNILDFPEELAPLVKVYKAPRLKSVKA
jgi:chorismate mutase